MVFDTGFPRPENVRHSDFLFGTSIAQLISTIYITSQLWKTVYTELHPYILVRFSVDINFHKEVRLVVVPLASPFSIVLLLQTVRCSKTIFGVRLRRATEASGFV